MNHKAVKKYVVLKSSWPAMVEGCWNPSVLKVKPIRGEADIKQIPDMEKGINRYKTGKRV